MFFEPCDFKCYSSDGSGNYSILTENQKNIIKDTMSKNRRFSNIVIEGTQYLLVNLVEGDTDFNNVRLILAPYQFEYDNTGGFINEIILKKVTIKLQHRSKFSKRSLDCKMTPKINM